MYQVSYRSCSDDGHSQTPTGGGTPPRTFDRQLLSQDCLGVSEKFISKPKKASKWCKYLKTVRIVGLKPKKQTIVAQRCVTASGGQSSNKAIFRS